jgi:hypothetical protein
LRWTNIAMYMLQSAFTIQENYKKSGQHMQKITLPVLVMQ